MAASQPSSAGGVTPARVPYVPPISDEELARRNRAAIELLDSWETEGDEEEQRETMAILREAIGEPKDSNPGFGRSRPVPFVLGSRRPGHGDAMRSALDANSEAAILERVIRPEEDDLAPEAARSILRLGFRPRDLERMDELAARAREGTLTEADRAEVASYEHVGHLIALLKSKARRSLSWANASA